LLASVRLRGISQCSSGDRNVHRHHHPHSL
jgi:hypothetical protein